MSENKLIIVTYIDHVDYYFKNVKNTFIFKKLECN